MYISFCGGKDKYRQNYKYHYGKEGSRLRKILVIAALTAALAAGYALYGGDDIPQEIRENSLFVTKGAVQWIYTLSP